MHFTWDFPDMKFYKENKGNRFWKKDKQCVHYQTFSSEQNLLLANI